MLKISLFSKGIYKSQLSRFKWGSLLYFVILFFSTSFMLIMEDFTYISDGRLERYLDAGGIVIHEDWLIVPILLASVVPTVVSFLSFDMFSSKKQSVFIHSLPCGRNSIYISTLLSAFTLMAIPIVVNGIILMLLSVFKLGQLSSIFACIKWIVLNISFLFIMFSIATFSASLTANRVSMVFINGLLHILPLIITFGIGGIASEYLYGFNNNYNSFIDKTVEWMPISFAWIYNGNNNARFIENIFSYKGTIFVTGAFILYIIGLVLYKKRNNEVAGNFVAFKIMNPIFKYTITAIGVVVTYTALYSSGFERGFYMLFLIVVVSFILYFASEMVLKKNLKVFGTYKGYLVFALICIILNTFVQHTSFFGYEKRIPDINEIESVAMYASYEEEKPYTADKAVITDVVKYHKDIISNIPSVINNDENNWAVINVEYKLKDGKTFVRKYRDLSDEKRDSILTGLYQHIPYRLACDNVYNIDISKLNYIRLSFDAGNFSLNFGIEGKNNIEAFLKEWEKDISNLGYKEKSESSIMYLTVDEYEKTDYFEENSYIYLHKGFNNNYKNVMKYLEKNGYLEKVYRLDGAKVYISKEYHKIETKTVVESKNALTRQYFDGKEEDLYILKENEVEILSEADKMLLVKDVCNGTLKKDYVDGERYIIYALNDNTTGFERYSMFLTVEKNELPDYLKKYVN